MGQIGRTTYSAVATLAAAGLLSGLLGSPSSADSSPSAAQWRAMGSTHAANGVLRNGCHYYRYSYKVDPPSGTWWTLEVGILGPKEERLASDVAISGADARKGTSRFQLCKSNTEPGRYTIRAKLTYKDYPDEYAGWITPSHFHLSAP